MKQKLFPIFLTAALLTACASGAPTGTETDTASAAAVETPAETAAAEAAGDPNLLFEDNFDGTELDETKWERCPEWDRQGGMDVWDNDMSYLDGNGNLILRAEWDETEGKLHSGAIRTNGCYSEAFGYYEASVKFPTAPGIWGAFWMMVGAVGSEENGALDGVEIDIIESINANNGVCNHAIHWDGYGDKHQQIASEPTGVHIYDGEFHTFGLERTEDAYVFYVDGTETWRVAEDTCTICPEDGYMKLTVEGAEWAGLGTAESIAALPVEMVVDYVRVYREKP